MLIYRAQSDNAPRWERSLSRSHPVRARGFALCCAV